MKKWAPVAVAVVALAAAGLAVWLNLPGDGPRVMTLRVSGPAGTRVSATLEADGRASTQQGVVPCEFSATASTLVFEVKKLDGPAGQIRVDLTAGGRECGSNSGLHQVTGRLEVVGSQVFPSTSGR